MARTPIKAKESSVAAVAGAGAEAMTTDKDTAAIPKITKNKKDGSGIKKKKRKKNKTEQNFTVCIYRLLKQIHPELRISKKSMYIMNNCMNDIFDRIATEGKMLTKEVAHSKTLSSREMRSALKLVFGSNELSKHAENEATKAIGKFELSNAEMK